MIELLRGSEVLRICKEKKQTIGAMMLERETELQGKSKQVLLADMQQQLTTMRLAIKRGLDQQGYILQRRRLPFPGKICCWVQRWQWLR